MHLYETHVPVASTETSAKFYVDIVELEFAYRDSGRDVVFLWIGTGRRSMLGLWGADYNTRQSPAPMPFCHCVVPARPSHGRQTAQQSGCLDSQFRG